MGEEDGWMEGRKEKREGGKKRGSGERRGKGEKERRKQKRKGKTKRKKLKLLSSLEIGKCRKIERLNPVVY